MYSEEASVHLLATLSNILCNKNLSIYSHYIFWLQSSVMYLINIISFDS